MQDYLRGYDMNYKQILEQYQEDLKTSQGAFSEFKKKMGYARKAFLNEIPDDIRGAASNEIYLNGYITDEPIRDSRAKTHKSEQQQLPPTCSKMLLPIHKAITKKMIDNMTAIPPRYEWDANRKDYVAVSRALEREFAKFYTKMNLAGKLPRIIKTFVRDGVFVQQTVFRELSETVMRWQDGRPSPENIYNKGAVDYIVYNPMTTYFDWDADPLDYRGTARFIIVTISSSMTEKAFRRKFPDFKEPLDGHTQKMEDLLDSSGDSLLGKRKPSNSVTLREYCLDNGKFYVIVNDAYVVAEGYASNGDLSRIPINVGFCYDDYITLWEELKWPVAAMSNAFNQVADNNAFNNTAPIYCLGDIMIDPLAYDPADGRKIFRINPLDKNIVRASDAMHQFTIPEITQGAMFMYEKGKESLFYVTGTSDMTFGMQDKQIRVTSVADMIGEALVRSDSDIAKRIENSFYNPVTWDILRIFYTRYEYFDFQEQSIPPDFLKDYRNIRVVNGSYLPSDRMVRLAKLQEALRLAVEIPERTNLENLFYDLYEAIGFVDPYRYLKTDAEYWATELAGTVMALLEQGAINEEQASQMIEAIKLIDENKDLVQEMSNG